MQPHLTKHKAFQVAGIEIEMLGTYYTGIREVSCLFVCKQSPKFSRKNVFVKTTALLP